MSSRNLTNAQTDAVIDTLEGRARQVAELRERIAARDVSIAEMVKELERLREQLVQAEQARDVYKAEAERHEERAESHGDRADAAIERAELAEAELAELKSKRHERLDALLDQSDANARKAHVYIEAIERAERAERIAHETGAIAQMLAETLRDCPPSFAASHPWGTRRREALAAYEQMQRGEPTTETAGDDDA